MYFSIVYLNILSCSENEQKKILTFEQILKFDDDLIRNHYQEYINSFPEDKKKYLEKVEKKNFFQDEMNQQIKYLLSIKNTLNGHLVSFDNITEIDRNRILQTCVQGCIDSIYLDLETTYLEGLNNQSTLLTYQTKHFSKLLREAVKEHYSNFISIIAGSVKEFHEFKQIIRSLEILYTDFIKPDGILDKKINIFVVESKKKLAELAEEKLGKMKNDFLKEFDTILENAVTVVLSRSDFIIQKKIESFYHAGFKFFKLGTSIVASCYFFKKIYEILHFYLNNKTKKRFDYYQKLTTMIHLLGVCTSVYYVIKNKKYFEKIEYYN